MNAPLLNGTVFANRFDIDRAVRSGGMGVIYRARDRYSGDWVALKLLQSPGASSPESARFTREAELLEELRHPGIVAHIAHGQTPEGVCFLAMQWLDGEDLAQRLRRGPLAIADAVLLLRRAAEALALAHRRGVVHRDLKPANLFLPDGQVDRITLLDFGIARRAAAARAITRTGLVIGTPEYMAPEQARGDRAITPAADVFALGCVLYECLTGRPAFSGDHIAAVLVRILLEEPRPAHHLRPEVPRALALLLDRMLAKDPALRPAHAGELLEALEVAAPVSAVSLASLASPAPPASTESPGWIEGPLADTLPGESTARPSFAQGDLALFCVIIAAHPGAGPEDAPPLDPEARRQLTSELRARGARVEWLLDGSLIATLAGMGSAVDQAVQAARAALLVKERWPEAEAALATGRGAVEGDLPVGEVVDRAARLLRAPPAPAPGSAGVWLDELSAGLLERGFCLAHRGDAAFLPAEGLAALAVDEGFPLLGRPTPCVGREQDLAILEALLSGCVEESEAQAAVITAAPGVGKSRLLHELLRRLAARGDEVTVLLGRGDMMTAGSPYAMLSDALRRACGLGGGLTLEAQRARLAERVGQSLAGESPADRRRVVAFLGELCGVPVPDDGDLRLRVARSDPKLMSDQLSQALLDFLRAECRRAPLLVVLDDLQWGDALTVKLLGAALRELTDRPFMVLALARPEVHAQFPRLWAGCRMREINLGGLSRKACERLIRQALGPDLPAEAAARLVEQCAGNALFLEELIRAQAAGKGEALPETVRAMLQARISRLEVGARLALRAASVFGQTFWRGGLLKLLQQRGAQELDDALERLVELELIEQRRDSRFAGEPEYGFRHALVCEAAYDLLTEDDRRYGHRLAGAHLEALGEPDPLVLAEHFQRGGLLEQAAVYYLRAGSQSFDRDDLEGALRRAERGLACDPQGETAGNLYALQAMAHCWRWEMDAGDRMLREALPRVGRGSRWECIVLFHGTWSSLVRGDEAEFAAMAGALAAFEPGPDVLRDYVLWAPLAASLITSYGRRALAGALLDRAGALLAAMPAADLDLRGALAVGRGDYVRAFERAPWQQLLLAREAVQAFEAIGDRRNQTTALNRLGQAESELGDPEAGERTLRRAVDLARQIRVPFAEVQAALHLGALLCKLPARPPGESAPRAEDPWSEADRIAAAVLGSPGVSAGYRGWAHGIRAQVLLNRGAFAEALAAAREAEALCARVPMRRLWVITLLLRALLGLRQEAEAEQLARRIDPEIACLGGAGYIEVDARLAAAEAFVAAGCAPEARAAAREVLRQIEARAAGIPDPSSRARYLENVAENARARALALDLLASAAG